MSKLKLIPAWGWATAILLVAAVIFRFALRGYSYIAHTLTFIAALILLPLADTYVHHTERYGRGLLKPRHAPTEDEETARPLEP